MVIQKTDQTMQAVQNENLQKSAGKKRGSHHYSDR